jgi:hypothetical protein
MSFLCPITDYYCSSCPNPEEGRVSAVAFVRAGIPIGDPTLNQTWVDIICNDYGVIIPNVRGEYNGGEAKEGDGYGRVLTRRQSTTHELTYFHEYSCENVDFYNLLNYSRSYELWYTNGNKLWRSGVVVFASAKAPITADPSDTIEFEVMARWSNKNLPTCSDAPSIFQSCEEIERLLDCLTCSAITIPCP